MKYLFIIIFFLLTCSLLISGYLNNQIMQHTAKLQYTKSRLLSFKEKTGTLQQTKIEVEVNNYNSFSFSHYNPAIITNSRGLLTLSKGEVNKLIGKLVQIKVPFFYWDLSGNKKNRCWLKM